MKISVTGFITSKKNEDFKYCADNYAINETNHKFSISDGVSQSFFPKFWSEILVTQFVERTDLKESELINSCQDEWQKRIDEIICLPETKWFTKSQYNRRDPALATFVGLQFIEKEKKWSASALGDSFLFFVPNSFKDYQKELVKLSSKVDPIIFDNFPDYLTSRGGSHKGRPKEKSGSLKNGTFYLMTDALAEWFINEGEKAIGKITVWKSQADFERFINQAINESQIVNDDCAILCVELSEVDRDGIEYKKIQVTDINDLINNQEAEKEKIRQKIHNEKLKQENEEEKQIADELETSQEELLNQEIHVIENNEEPHKERLISKVYNIGKEIFSKKGKTSDLEKSSGLKADTEKVLYEEPNSETLEKTDEEPQFAKTTEVDDSNAENDKSEELQKEKIEEEFKNVDEKPDSEELEQKEQLKVDPRTKKIFDKF